MTRLLCVAGLALLLTGCGSDSTGPSTPTTPTTPVPPVILPANLTTAPSASLSLPGCDALARLSFGLGVATVTCPSFSAPAINTGSGCAANAQGTLTITTPSGAQVGSANWSYTGHVLPGQQFVIEGGRIVVPSSLSFSASASFVWTNVAC